jgi:Na+-driven multidrug efflux pump
MALSATTFVGQNLGANNVKRAKAGTRIAVILSLISTAILIVPLMVFARQMISLFNADPEVLQFGSLFIWAISPFYLLCVINQVYAGSLRGAGDTRASMIIMLTSFVVLRQIYLFMISKFIDSVIPVALGYPLGWLIASISIYIYYRSGRWEKKRVVVSEYPTAQLPQENISGMEPLLAEDMPETGPLLSEDRAASHQLRP